MNEGTRERARALVAGEGRAPQRHQLHHARQLARLRRERGQPSLASHGFGQPDVGSSARGFHALHDAAQRVAARAPQVLSREGRASAQVEVPLGGPSWVRVDLPRDMPFKIEGVSKAPLPLPR